MGKGGSRSRVGQVIGRHVNRLHRRDGTFLGGSDALLQRARKIQRFLSQPFHVSEKFTGIEGTYVPLSETVKGFKAIIDGECDELPESAFLFAGTIDEVRAKAERAAK